MKNYHLLLVVLCSVLAIQSANSTKLRAKSMSFTPTNYFIEITNIDGVQARDVSVAGDGTIWYVSTVKDGDNYRIYRIPAGSQTPELSSGFSGLYISGANDGGAWGTNKAGNIFKYTGSWQKVDGTGYDISAAPDGNIYLIGTSEGIYARKRDDKSWQNLGGAGVRIAGGPSQSVWHINRDNNIYRRYSLGDWEQISGKATDIGISENGLVWILTTSAAPNQFAVFDEYKQDWVNVPLSDYLAKSGESWSNSKTVRIAAAPDGDLLGVREDGSMFRLRFNWTYDKQYKTL